MQDTNKCLIAITKYLIEENSFLNGFTFNSDICFVVSHSANKKYWLLLCEKIVHLFNLETNEDILLDSIQPVSSQDETSVGNRMLVNMNNWIKNVIWNEEEKICIFTEFYTSLNNDNGNLIIVDFSVRPVRIEKRTSIIKRCAIETHGVAAPGEPHLACVLLLDTSSSMAGEPINSLNRAINDFKTKTSMDDLAQKRVEIAIIKFDDVPTVVQDFTPISQMEPVNLDTNGTGTAMGAAINLAIDKVKERNRFYASLGTPCFKPWIFMITDGASTDDITAAAQRIQEEESKGSHGKLKFWALGVPGYDKETLFKLTKRVMALSDTDFSGIFNWMSESMLGYDEDPILGNLPSNDQVVPSDW